MSRACFYGGAPKGIVGLIDNPSSGEYLFFEHEISQYSESRLANLREGNVGFIFQSFNWIDELKAICPTTHTCGST